MAWRRDESSSFISGSTIYAYTEVDWNVGASRCTYTHLGGVTSPYYWDTSATGTLFWREWSGGAWGAWNEYASGTAHFGGYGDKELVRTDGFFARQAADREVQLACDVTAAGGTGSAWLTYTVPHLPNAPASITATRVSDNQVTVSWTAPTRSYDAMCLEVSIDGGSWSEFTQLWNASTSTTYGQASADHSYRFRARAYYQSAYSDYTSPTAAVAMTPSAPQSISVAASGGTNVTVTLSNASPVATSLEYQTSTDGGSTWIASTTVSGSPVTSFSTSVSGTALIRVRNKNATGVSDWLVSNPITTICPPAPPTLRTPSGSIYDMAQGDIEFSWLHNSLDGSTQTAYQLRYAINGGVWTTLSGTTSQSLTVSIGTFSVGNAVTWQVRTKGADANFSEWSQTGAFNVYTAPTLSITSPGATITGMPINLTATYSDMAGFTCQAATASLTKDGRTLYSEAATVNGTSITSSLDVDEFLPTNGESYTVVLTARSSSGLSTSANATFTVDFVEPQAGELSVVNDPETGYASLLATFDNSASEQTYTGSTNEQYESSDGYVRSLTVEGKSEKWNQLTSTMTTTTTDGITTSYDPSTHLFTIKNDSRITNYSSGSTRGALGSSFVIGNTYALLGDSVTGAGITRGASPSTFAAMDSIFTNTEANTFYMRVTNAYNFVTAHPVGDVTTFHMCIYDLTAIFGAGNEPATVDAFKATDVYKAKLAAGELYDYDAGSLVSIEGVGVGDGTITTPLRSAGSVHDTLMADADSWTVARKVGYVDLGSLTWTRTSWNNVYYFQSSSLTNTVTDNNRIHSICSAYETVSSTSFSDLVDKTYRLFNDKMQVHDDSYTDAAAFKAAMSGVYLFYELATPTQDAETSMSRIEIGSAFTVATDLDSTFELTTWDGSADAVSVSVSRVNADGTITPLLTDGASGSGLVDRYAPLNTPYQYAVTTTAASQAVKTVYVDNELVTDLWFAYWGDNIASAKWNPDNGGIQVTRPQKTRVYYAGRRDPVSYDGHAVSLTETPSWMFLGKDEVDTFVQLIEDGGRGIYKSCDGWVYHADFDLTMTPSYTAIGYYGGASLGITRIAGERL